MKSFLCYKSFSAMKIPAVFGPSGSGKTPWIEQLVGGLERGGLSVLFNFDADSARPLFHFN